MQLHFPTFSHLKFSYFQDNILSSLTPQHRKILGIVILALGFLATCLTAYRLIKRCYAKAEFLHKADENVNQNEEQASSSSEKTKNTQQDKLNKNEKIRLFFVACQGGPAAHFSVFGQQLDPKKY